MTLLRASTGKQGQAADVDDGAGNGQPAGMTALPSAHAMNANRSKNWLASLLISTVEMGHFDGFGRDLPVVGAKASMQSERLMITPLIQEKRASV